MSNILRLVVKDIALMRRFAALLLLAELALVVVLAVQVKLGPSLGLVCLIVAFVGGFLICLRSTVLEEKNRAFLFIRLLPVSTIEIVFAKFATNIVVVGVNSGLLYLIGGLRITGLAEGWGFDVEFSRFVIFLAAQWTCNAVFVATALSFGSEKAIWTPFALLFVLFNVLLNIETLGLAEVAEIVTSDAPRSFSVAILFVVAMAALSIFAMQRRRIFG